MVTPNPRNHRTNNSSQLTGVGSKKNRPIRATCTPNPGIRVTQIRKPTSQLEQPFLLADESRTLNPLFLNCIWKKSGGNGTYFTRHDSAFQACGHFRVAWLVGRRTFGSQQRKDWRNFSDSSWSRPDGCPGPAPLLDRTTSAGIAASPISEVLAGKRKLNRGQIAKLARYFHIEPRAFLAEAKCRARK